MGYGRWQDSILTLCQPSATQGERIYGMDSSMGDDFKIAGS